MKFGKIVLQANTIMYGWTDGVGFLDLMSHFEDGGHGGKVLPPGE